MIGALLTRLRVWLPERENALPVVILVCEAGVVLALVFGLDLSVAGFVAPPYLITAYLAVLGTRAISMSAKHKCARLSVLLFGGMLTVMVSTMRMWSLVGLLVLNSSSSGVYLGMPSRLIRFLDQAEIYLRISQRLDVLITNFQVWGDYLLSGSSIQVSQMTQMIWGTVILLVMLSAGWFLHVKRRPFPAVIVPIMALGIAAEFTNYPLHYFGLLAALSLLMVVVFSHAERERDWAGSGYGYSLEIRSDLWGVAALMCVAVFLISVFPPDMSLRTWLEKNNLIGEEPSSQVDLTSGLGLSELYPEPGSSVASGGLPSSHLISSPPDQLDTHLFDVWVGDDQTRIPAVNWRTHTYQTYTGHGWLTGDVVPVSYLADEDLPIKLPSRQAVNQITVWVRSDQIGGVLIHAYQVVRVDQPVDILWRNGEMQPVDYSLGVVDKPRYTVRVSRPVVSPAQLRVSTFEYPDWVESRYLQLPNDLPEEVLGLAREFVSQYDDPFSRAQAIESYLRTIPYNLDVPLPPGDKDVVSYFLFDLRQGYCDYFATAMAVLARGAGLPARVVAGYARGTSLTEENIFRVTAADAHTWVEIYFAELGWVEFEPTPSRPRMEYQTGLAGEEIVEPEGADTDLGEAGLDPGNLLIWTGAAASFILLAMTVWNRIRYQRLSKEALLLSAREQLYQTAGLFEIDSPRCLTPRENMAGILSGLAVHSESRLWRAIRRNAPEVVGEIVRRLESTAYGGESPSDLVKKDLVQDLVRSGRLLRSIRMVNFLRRS